MRVAGLPESWHRASREDQRWLPSFSVTASPHNPDSNVLPPGLSDEDLLAAVESSGYPLQTFVANTLAPDFILTEEWTYVDSDSTAERAIDLHAVRLLYDPDLPTLTLRPIVDLFIECKRSVSALRVLSDRPPTRHSSIPADCRPQRASGRAYPL